MKNVQCLDANKMRQLIETICEKNSYESKEFYQAIDASIIGWHSRSIAAALFIFGCDDNGSLYVLAAKRGVGAADFKGYWNCPCGYLDYNETIQECAIREAFEETGVNLKEHTPILYEVDDNITANHQNVTFIYHLLLKNKTIKNIQLSNKYNEPNETEQVKWISVNEIDNYSWAFGHQKYIKKLVEKYII